MTVPRVQPTLSPGPPDSSAPSIGKTVGPGSEGIRPEDRDKTRRWGSNGFGGKVCLGTTGTAVETPSSARRRSCLGYPTVGFSRESISDEVGLYCWAYIFCKIFFESVDWYLTRPSAQWAFERNPPNDLPNGATDTGNKYRHPNLVGAKRICTLYLGLSIIQRKFCPLRGFPWDDFPRVCVAAFGRLRTVVGNLEPLGFTKSALIEDILVEFLISEAFQNEKKSTAFPHGTLQKVTQKTLDVYLDVAGRSQEPYLDSRTIGRLD